MFASQPAFHSTLLCEERIAIFCGLTWKGYEFVDTLRSPEIWRKTKEGASKLGSVGLDVILSMGKAYVKQFAQEKLGLLP